MYPRRPSPDVAPELLVDCFSAPSADEPDVCGDFYGTVRRGGLFRLIVGDVTGHGRGADRLARALEPAWRAYATAEPVLRGVALRLDRFLTDVADEDLFATAVLLETDGSGWARMIFCGHPGPLMLREPSVVQVEPLIVNPPLGLFDLGGSWAEDFLLPFAQGDGLLFYTDGVTDTRHPDGTYYPLVTRAQELSAESPLHLPALADDLRSWWNKGPSDDALLVLLRFHTAALQPT